MIGIARPERRNAVDRATADALHQAWVAFDRDEESDVAILHGEGGHFSAGADLVAFDLVDRPEGFLGFTRITVSKPTIAAIEGYCLAGGLEMALWCDLRVAAEDAVLGFLERRFGVPLVDGGTQRLPRIVGSGRALDLILTGRTLSGSEALGIGLVERTAPPGRALATALELARQLVSYPQPTLRSDRRALLQSLGLSLEEGLEQERRLGLEVLDTAAEGAARFARGEGRGGTPLQ